MIKALIVFIDSENKGWGRWHQLHAIPSAGMGIVLDTSEFGMTDLGEVKSVAVSRDFVIVQMKGYVLDEYVKTFKLVNADEALANMPFDFDSIVW